METIAHQRLKSLSVAFLRERGCLAVAAEVRCSIPRYRADIAGYRDGPPAAQTIIIECKQARGDFRRDVARRDRLLEERRELDRIRTAMERQRVMVREPHLRREGSSLFPELDEWDFSRSRLPGYRRVLRRLRQLDEKIHGQTKFCLLAQYRLADRLYLAAPHGLVNPGELPPGWGLLECSRRALDRDGETSLRVRVEAPELRSRDRHRHRMLRNIAVAASFAALGRSAPSPR